MGRRKRKQIGHLRIIEHRIRRIKFIKNGESRIRRTVLTIHINNNNGRYYGEFRRIYGDWDRTELIWGKGAKELKEIVPLIHEKYLAYRSMVKGETKLYLVKKQLVWDELSPLTKDGDQIPQNLISGDFKLVKRFKDGRKFDLKLMAEDGNVYVVSSTCFDRIHKWHKEP